MPGPSTNIFVSYSHADTPLVEPVVRLLRANRSLVFRDADSVRPGARWRSAIAEALAGAELVVVFWCAHASRSEEVSSEWRTAIDQGKDVLPLLLDATPLPPELSEYQWIDFRATVGPGHDAGEATSRTFAPGAARAEAPRRAGSRLGIAAAALAVVAAAGVGLLTLMAPEAPVPQATPPTGQEVAAFAGFVPIALTAVVVAGLLVAGLLLWRRRKARAPRIPAPQPEVIEQRIAEAVEDEILRRAGAR